MKKTWKDPDHLIGILGAAFAVALVGVLFFHATMSLGEQRTSESYIVESDSLNIGGTTEGSANYSNLGIIGETPGGTAESSGYTLYSGFGETLNSTPEAPTTLAQYRSNGSTSISTGTWINSSTVVIKFNVYDPDASDVLTPQVESRITAESFTGSVTHTGPDINFAGSTVEAVVTMEGLSNGAYHWRARVNDSGNLTSPWASYGGNSETDIDFGVDITAPAVSIINPHAGSVINGGITYEITWIVTEEGGSGLVANPIKIYYSTNEGSSWSTIATNEANDGSYVWSVPTLNSSSCKVSIEALDNAGNTGRAISASFEASSYGWIAGTVALLGEANNSGALVDVFIKGRTYGTAESASDGSYLIKVLTGTYSVEARKAGYLTGVYQGPVQVISGTTVEGVDLSMAKGWPQYHLDQHLTGNSPHKQMQLPLSVKWVYNWTAAESSPSYANGKVFVVGSTGQIRAINASDGTLAWAYTPTGVSASGSTPCYYDGRVYFVASNKIVCLRASDGAFIWESATLLDVSGKCSPAVHRGVVFVSSSNNNSGYAYYNAYDAYTGSQLWSRQLQSGVSLATPSLDGNNLYIVSHSGAAGAGRITNLDPSSGVVNWDVNRGALSERGVAYANNRLFGLDSGSPGYLGRIFGFKTSTRTNAWAINTGAEAGDWYHIPAVSGETVYVGSANGKFYSIKAFSNVSTGEINWSIDLGSRVNCSPAVENGMVFFTTQTNTLCAVSANDGTVLWSYRVSAAQWENTSPIVTNGALYATSYRSKVFAFYTNSTPEVLSTSPGQFKLTGIALSTGEWTNETKVVFKMRGTDPDYADILHMQVEIKPTAEAFDGGGLATGEGFAWNRDIGTLEVICTVEGIADSSSGYHWRARIIDQYNSPSAWYSFGGNQETDIDFKTDSTPPVISVLKPQANEVVYGSGTYEITWIVTEEGGSGLILNPIKIYYSTNEGSSWATLATNEANDGSYIWSVPLLNSTECGVSVEARDNAGNVGEIVSGKFKIFGDGWITGLITRSGGGNQYGTLVEAYKNGIVYASFPTMADRSYFLKLLSGTYSLEASYPGFEIKDYPSPITVPVNGTAEGVNMQLNKAWPVFQQDKAQTGSSPDKVIFPPLVLRWSYDSGGSILVAPIIANGKVFFGNNNTYKSFALDENSGALFWSIASDIDTRSTAVYANGRVIFGGGDGIVRSRNESDGSAVWSFSTGGYHLYSPLSFAHERVFFGASNYKFYCLRESDGGVVWSYLAGQTFTGNSAMDGGKVFVGSADHKLYAFNESSGTVEWSYTSGGAIQGGPAVAGGRVYFPCQDNKLYALEQSTGAFIWSYPTGALLQATPTVVNSKIFFGSQDNKMYALDSTGAFLWSFPTGGQIRSSAAVANGIVYFGSMDSKIYALDEETGDLLWSHSMGSSVQCAPAILDGKLFIGSDDGKMYAFENNTSPEAPIDLLQYKADIVTLIATGEWTNGAIVLKMNMFDPDLFDEISPEVEVREISVPFSDVVTNVGNVVIYNGSTIEGLVTIEGLAPGSEYHWQARVKDSSGWVSPWTSFGGNDESSPDFGVDITAPAVSVLTPAQGETLIGGTTYEITWLVTEEGGSGLTATPISIYYSTNGGASWNPIAADEANDGSFVVDVPAVNWPSVRISVEAIDNASNIGMGVSGICSVYSSGWLSGTVTLSGQPDNANAYVEVFQNYRLIDSATTDATGDYSFFLSPGTYEVGVLKSGYEQKTNPSTITVTSAATTDADFTISRAWSTYGQDRWHTGYSPDTVLTAPLAPRWIKYGYGSNSSAASIVNGVAYLSAGSKTYALYADTGNVKWSHSALAIGAPTVVDGVVYIHANGGVYAVSAETGSNLWAYPVPNSEIRSAPLIADGAVYFGTYGGVGSPEVGGKFIALNRTNGALLWSYQCDGVSSIWSSPVYDNGTVLFGNYYGDSMSPGGKFYALDANNNGAFKWSFDAGNWIWGSPAVKDGVVYFGITSGSGNFYALNVEDGTVLWSYNVGGMRNAPAIGPDSVYVFSGGTKLIKLAKDSGTLVWSRSIPTQNAMCSPVVSNGTVYLLAGDSLKCYAMGLSDANGSIIFNYLLTVESTSTFSIADGKAYCGTNNSFIQWENNKDPNSPTILKQYLSDGTTEVSTGGWSGRTTVLKQSMNDQNNYDWLYDQVEVRTTADSFTGTVTSTGPAFSYSGSSVTGMVTVENLSAGSYHWRSRVMDAGWVTSSWVSFGGNAEDEMDFKVDAAFPLVIVTKPITSEIVPGGRTYEVTWIASDESGSGIKQNSITIYYTTNEGVAWYLIASGEANDGKYVWTPPAANFTGVRISVEAMDNVFNLGRGKSGLFDMLGDGWIKGTITLSEETDYSGALVEACLLGKMYADDTSGVSGSYMLRVPMGTYEVEASKGGFGVRSYSTIINVSSGATVEGININLPKAWEKPHQDFFNSSDSPDKRITVPLAPRMLWSYGTVGDIKSPAVVSEGKVYFYSYSGPVYGERKIFCLNRSDGSFVWSFYSNYTVTTPLTIYRGNLYCNVSYIPNPKLFAFNAATGAFLWSVNNVRGPSAADGGLVGARGLIYVGDYSNTVAPPVFRAFRADNGDLAWSHTGTYTNGRFWDIPALYKNNLYLSDSGSSVLQRKAIDLDPSTGSLLWSAQITSVSYTCFTYNNGKLFGSRSLDYNTSLAYAICLSAVSGETLWSYATTDPYIYGASTVHGGIVYVSGNDGVLYALNKDTGTLAWSFVAGGSMYTTPTVANGLVFEGSLDKNLYAFSASTGDVLWSYRFDDPLSEQPTIVNGELYIPVGRTLYVFEANVTPEAPTMLRQYQADGVTQISSGEWTGSRGFMKMLMNDPNRYDKLYPEIEVKATSDAFSQAPTASGEGIIYYGVSIEGTAEATGLANMTAYHWQARVRDESGYTSPWVPFGGGQLDFMSDTITPESPSGLNAIAMPFSSPTYVALNWTAGTDESPGSGLRGYYYYRSASSTEGYVVKNTIPISGTSTTDVAVTGGNTYYYRLTLKDQAGNESPYSNLSSPPNLILTRIMTIESPKTGGYSGGAGDAVPGSTVTYTISYTNNGFGIASGMVFIDKVPVYTEYKIGSATGEMISSVLFSNNGGTTYSYSPTGEAVDPNVTNIKWMCRDLPVSQSKTVRFKVIIK